MPKVPVSQAHSIPMTRTCHHNPRFQRYDFVACSPSQFLQWICAPRHEIITLELKRFEVFMLLYFQRYDFVSGCANPLQKLGRGASNEIVRLKIWLMMTCPGACSVVWLHAPAHIFDQVALGVFLAAPCLKPNACCGDQSSSSVGRYPVRPSIVGVSFV